MGFLKKLINPKKIKVEKNKSIKLNRHFVVFDLETPMIPKHARGKNVHHSIKSKEIKKLKIKCACAYVSKDKKYVFYKEDSINKLIELLHNTPTIVGYNILGFDLPVLEKYGANSLLKKKSVDLMQEVSLILPDRQFVKLTTVGRLLLHMKHPYKDDRDKKRANSVYDTTPEKLLKLCKRDVQITKKLYEFWMNKNKNNFKYKKRLALLNQVTYARQMSKVELKSIAGIKIPIYQEWKTYILWGYDEDGWEGNYDRFRSWEAKRNWENNNCTSHHIKPANCIYCKKGILSIIKLKDISPEKIKYISNDYWGSQLGQRLIRMSCSQFVKYKNGYWRPACCNNCNKITLIDINEQRHNKFSETKRKFMPLL